MKMPFDANILRWMFSSDPSVHAMWRRIIVLSRKNYECISLCKLLYLSREARDYRAKTDKRRGIKILYKSGRPVTRIRSRIIEIYTCIALRDCLKSSSKLATGLPTFSLVCMWQFWRLGANASLLQSVLLRWQINVSTVRHLVTRCDILSITS